VSRDEVMARAWTWFEPQPPAPALIARATEIIARAES
jgi:hypothetical protein